MKVNFLISMSASCSHCATLRLPCVFVV